MRVDLAAQVLIYLVNTLPYTCTGFKYTEALRLTGGEEAKECVCFVEMFDELFDCMNVNNFHSQEKTISRSFQAK